MKKSTKRTITVIVIVMICSILATIEQYVFNDQSHTAHCAFFAQWASIFCISGVIDNVFNGKDDNDNG